MSVHSCSKELEPTVDEAIGVNAGKKAGQVLVVDERRCLGVEVTLLEELNQFKDIAFGQVVGKCRWDELVDELGDAVEHRSKWCGVEAHDGATRLRTELFLPF